MNIYELFGVIPIMKILKPVTRWGSNMSHYSGDFHLHFIDKNDKCYHKDAPICRYLCDISRINGTDDGSGKLDSRIEDLVWYVYSDWRAYRYNVSIINLLLILMHGMRITIVHYGCDYIVRLIPNKIKMLMNAICEELEYLPPNYLLSLGGIICWQTYGPTAKVQSL